jgi:hypothetical protein
MNGTWTESFTNQTCPNCAAAGKPDSRLYMMATVEPKFSILQMRCHVCRAVRTEVSSSSPEALAAARKAHKRARLFA